MWGEYKAGCKGTGRRQAVQKASHAEGKPCTKIMQCSFVDSSLARKTNCIPRHFGLISILTSQGLTWLITCHLKPATSDACVV